MTDSSGSRRPDAGRIYNCLLGGKDNYGEDRESAERLLAAVPDARAAAWDSRRFLTRAVRFLVKDAGIRQFIDIGTGLPAMGNVHEVAHELAPDPRVAYVDNDPVVASHARALLCTAPNVCAIQGDLRDPSGILNDPVLQAQVDLREPAVCRVGRAALADRVRWHASAGTRPAGRSDSGRPGGKLTVPLQQFRDAHSRGEADGRPRCIRTVTKR